MTKKDVRLALYNLVGRRMSLEMIKLYLKGCCQFMTIKISEAEEYTENEDFHLLVMIGDFDCNIWYLKTRKENVFYITETSVD